MFSTLKIEIEKLSYGKLEQKGFVLDHLEWRRALVSCTGGMAVMDADCGNNVLFVKVYDEKFRGCSATMDVIMAVLAKSEHEYDLNVQWGTLAEIIDVRVIYAMTRLSRWPETLLSGIKLTDTRRDPCLACAQGKQTKTVQSNKVTGKNSPLMSLEE
uniref:AlNc14C81G5286 protein n=1 Tax=Albugo laibachii Nc14 TaxID=890382 RepID=F0WF94_9STRA|nr:AlNc14C81G5286 [Albugo laibachii Nc14]|eukprot:CCA19876.1 AlNc14C81G5286 [Albugo laibachii Nc14]